MGEWQDLGKLVQPIVALESVWWKVATVLRLSNVQKELVRDEWHSWNVLYIKVHILSFYFYSITNMLCWLYGSC